jgi:alpha/beta hydrolase fold
MRESILARAARAAVRICLKPALQPEFSVGTQRVWANIAARLLSVPFGVRFVKAGLAGVPVEKVQPKAGGSSSACALLFLHGGGFLIGSPVSHRSITGRLAKLARVTVYAPDYRLAPNIRSPRRWTTRLPVIASSWSRAMRRSTSRLPETLPVAVLLCRSVFDCVVRELRYQAVLRSFHLGWT